MLTRRDVLRSFAGVGAVSAAYPWLVGCGDSQPNAVTPPAARGAGIAIADVARAKGGSDAQPAAVGSVQALSTGLYGGLAAKPGNLIFSPYSVAVALAMTRNGAGGRTAAQMSDVLHAPALPTYNAGMNALTQLMESRAGSQKRLDGTSAMVSLDVANSLWGQHGTTWKPAFLEALARYYGAGMRLVDYSTDPDGAAGLINAWTADHTEDKIPQIIPPGVLDAMTRLVLVNAIYLKAPWEEPFEVSATAQGSFTRADGSTVQTAMMNGSLKTSFYARGSGWQAARLLYAGQQLAMTVVVPDGSLDALEASLDSPGLAQILTSPQSVNELELTMPSWKFRLATGLNDILAGLGMPLAFDPTRADFSQLTTDERLYISAVLHDAFIAVDEHGTEAAAATAVVMETAAGSIPTVLKADKAFMFVIHDVDTATPLFVGRVDDPTA